MHTRIRIFACFLSTSIAFQSLETSLAFAQPPSKNLEQELDAIKQDLARLESADKHLLPKVVGPLTAAVVSAFVSYAIFVLHSGKKERRQRAVDLLNQFMTSEQYLRCRLVIQEYLLPNGSKFDKSLDDDGNLLNFTDLTRKLEKSTEEGDNMARFDIRAISSFFWLVDQAHAAEYISRKVWWKPFSRDESLFYYHYTWYWVNIIRFRLQGCEDHRLFRKISWLLKDDEIIKCEQEFGRMINSLLPEQKSKWNAAVPASRNS